MRGALPSEMSKATDFAHATADVRALAAAAGRDDVAVAIHSTLDALSLFGVSDAYRRTSERHESLGIQSEAARRAVELNDRYNDAGLRTLVQARDAFRRLGEVATPNTRLDAVEADEMLRSFRDELGAVDLHANEVRLFSDYFEEVVDAARDEGLAGVASRADRGIGVLDQSRRQPDRGGNPWWKGLGFMIGVAAIFTLATLCSDPNLRPLYCPEWVRTLITLVGLAGAILAILC